MASVKDGIETRERLLRAAVNLYSAKGFAGASVLDVARRAGVTKGAFYHHFESKAHLIMAIHNSYVDLQIGDITAIVEKGLAPTETLAEAIGLSAGYGGRPAIAKSAGSQRWALDDTATECFTNGVAYGWSFIFQSRSLPDDIQPGTFLGLSWVPCHCYLAAKQTPYVGGQTLSTPVVHDANRAHYLVVSFSASAPGVVVPSSFFDQNA